MSVKTGFHDFLVCWFNLFDKPTKLTTQSIQQEGC